MSSETLTTLLDGECDAAALDRLLDEMERSPELKQQYSRLCMAREASEGTRILRGQPCLAAGVMARVAAEPMAAAAPKVVDLAERRRRRWAALKPAFGLAAAASVAALAVLVALPGLQPGSADKADGLGAQLTPEVGSAPAQLAPVSIPGLRARGAVRSVALTPEQKQQMDELTALMLEHSNSLSEQGMGGTLRYARVAAHPRPAVYHPEDAAGDAGR